ncbi:MAG: vitamin K epoxide reductase [Actinomycetota bacterium]|nr:vitamin K epoxide reductase [Actinomycetota bacterium]
MARRASPAGPPAATVRGASGGVGRSSSPGAEALSDDLRRGAGAALGARRRIAGLTLGAMGSMGMVAAYQFGLLRHLPEPPLPGLDSDRVDASGEAYQVLGTPDAALGLASYAATLALAGMGGRDRARDRPWLPLALAAKTLLDAASGAYLALEQGTKHRRFCTWCLIAAGSSVAMVPAALPEARTAWRHLRRGR